MSYSARDIEEAFDCALARDQDLEWKPWEHTKTVREQVFEHLVGDCSCDIRRCEKCGGRPRNGIPFHHEECPLR